MFGGSATAWAHRLGGTPPPQFIDPSTGQINPQIVAETHNGSHTTVTYKDGAQVTDGTGIQTDTLPKPADGKTGVASADYQAFVANHGQPVVVSLDQMVASTSSIVTEVGPWVTEPGCVGPPANFNIATATDAQLALYGFPAVGTMPRSIYNAKFAWMKHRDCQLRGTNGPPHGAQSASKANVGNATLTPRRAMGNPTERVPNQRWTGNVADENNCASGSGFACAVGSPSIWSEADADYYVSHLSLPSNCTSTCTSSYWVGIGGTGQVNGSGPNQLVQAGIEGDVSSSTVTVYPWVECYDNPVSQNPVQVNQMGIVQGSHVYTRIYTTSFEIGNIDNQTFNTWPTNATYCWPGGVTATENSAEFIVEAKGQNNGGTNGLTEFSNFWWHGVGVTDQTGYHSMDGATHDYSVAYWQFIQQPADQLMNIGPIQSDPNDYPYDKYETTWIEACPGSCP